MQKKVSDVPKRVPSRGSYTGGQEKGRSLHYADRSASDGSGRDDEGRSRVVSHSSLCSGRGTRLWWRCGFEKQIFPLRFAPVEMTTRFIRKFRRRLEIAGAIRDWSARRPARCAGAACARGHRGGLRRWSCRRGCGRPRSRGAVRSRERRRARSAHRLPAQHRRG